MTTTDSLFVKDVIELWMINYQNHSNKVPFMAADTCTND
jgi:hypothetical protein